MSQFSVIEPLPAKRRLRRKGPYTCANLMENALQIVAQEGFQAASFGRVAEACGVVRGVLYYHYSDRAAFVRALHGHTVKRRSERLRAVWRETANRPTSDLIDLFWGLLNEPPFRAYSEMERAARTDADLLALLAADEPIWATLGGAQADPAGDGRTLLELVSRLFDGLALAPPSSRRLQSEIRMMDFLKRTAVQVRRDSASAAA